jgi:Tfp pilus assembly protein PilF
MERAWVVILLTLTVSLSTSTSGAEVRPVEYRKIEQLILSGDYDEAAEKLKALLRRDPDNRLFNRALAYCLENVHDYDGAAKAYKKAIEAGDLSADTQARAGRCLQKLNRFEEASEHYLAALDRPLRPDGKAAILSGLAECQSRLGRDAEYREYLARLLPVDPKSARLIEARMLIREGKHERASVILTRLYVKDRKNPQIAYELARSLIEQGRELEFAEQLLDNTPGSPEVGTLDIDLALCHLHIKGKRYRKTMHLRRVLQNPGRLTPDQKAYRDRIFAEIEQTFH